MDALLLAERLAGVRAAIAAAALRSGRAPQDVTLVAVTKSAPPQTFGLLAAAGVTDAGESRVQDAERRLSGWETAFRWHLVGHLQSNKVRRAVPLFDVFHGVDSPALATRIDRVAGELGRRIDFLLQVNVSGEASKHGVPAEQAPAALAALAGLRHARLVGLMTMAPLADDPERARPVFAALRELRDRCQGRHGAPPLPELSMGMTDDFEVAVEEGATLVRVGRRLVDPAWTAHVS